MGIIKGLNIGKRALMAQTEATKVAGQNIANVNVPGNSRQRLELNNVIHSGEDSISVFTARRIRDRLVDQSIRSENQIEGNWGMQRFFYGHIENIFLEPSEYDLNNIMSQFWENWENLANNPENMSARSMVAHSGENLAKSLNNLNRQLRYTRATVDKYIEDKVAQINDMASKIADINLKIVAIEANGQEASEIRDSRDLFIDQISRMADLKVVEHDNGQLTVLIGGRAIVDGKEFSSLKINKIPDGDMMISNVVWADDNTNVRITGGEIAGLETIRDTVIPDILTKLDQLASTFIEEVNAIHETGFGFDGSTGLPFFVGTGISDISVNSEIANDVNKIATSQSSEIGDNRIALAIAELADQDVAPGNVDIGTFYSDIVSSLGAQARSANMMQENSGMFLKYMEEQREAISGVSLDEEMADMIKSQRAYESAAKYVSVVDELIGVLIDLV